jgi:hypothetical protein
MKDLVCVCHDVGVGTSVINEVPIDVEGVEAAVGPLGVDETDKACFVAG